MTLQTTNHRRFITSCLSDCCSRHEPVKVISPESGIVCQGEFRQLGPQSVKIQFRDNSFPMLSESLCCVSFTFQNRLRMFFTSILNVVDYAHPSIAISIPSQITTTERRRAMRIQVLPESGLSTSLTLHNGSTVQCWPANISLRGLLVQFGSRPMPQLTNGSYLFVTLSTPDASVQLPARLVRQDDQGFGLLFASEWHGGESDSPHHELVGIVKHVENAWMKKYLERTANDPRSLNSTSNDRSQAWQAPVFVR